VADFDLTSRSREALEPANYFLRYVRESGELVELSMRGTFLLTQQPALTKAMLELDEYRAGELNPDREHVLQDASRLADLAQRELQRDFPLLNAHAIVGVWGALESWIGDMCCRWVGLFPDRCDWGNRRIKVSPDDLLSDDPGQKAQVLLATLKADLKADEKLGVNQFESMLRPLGLSGPVPKLISDALFRMQQIRHIYAHRAGIADAVFVERCHSLMDCAVGERVHVDGKQMSVLTSAAVQYSHILHLRVEDLLFGTAEWPDELKS